ncbi:BT1A1 protein, partial [Casuarius casuarius]|nr:BT1A1 protein [Casuarius casuarius]
LFFSGNVPITIIIDPPVVLVGEQVTLHCWLADTIPSNMSVLWYKKEEGKNTTLCFSPSLGGVVEQCQNEEWCRTEGRWERRALLLIIHQVQVADEGAYVCAVKGDIGSQEAITHLDVTKMGNKPTFQRNQLEESMCCYTCKSKGWYPKPEVLWMNYGGKTINVEAKTNVTWNEEDLFTVQSNITVPCDNVDVTCAVILPKAKKSRTDLLYFFAPNPVPQLSVTLHYLGHSCFSEVGLISGELGNPQAMYFQGRKVAMAKALYNCDRTQKSNPAAAGAQYLFVADDVKADVGTAHPNLSIAEDGKSFRHNSYAQKVTQNEERFDSAVCVLGSEGFSSGKHYWEVEVEKSNDWDLGVARKSIQRKGIIPLSLKEGFWVLGSSLKDYWARTDPWTRVMVQKKPRKIGVYLNCEEKHLTFFNVTDMSVIFMFKDCAFSEEVYPFFKNSQ